VKTSSIRKPPRREAMTRNRVVLPLPLREFNRFKVGLRHVLVPIDFSAGSKRALVYALPLARVFGARVTLLHVVEPVSCVVDCGYGGVVREWPNEARGAYVKERLSRFARAFRKSGLPLDLAVRSGRAYTEIVACAGQLGADLIVISTRGLGNRTGEPMGSTAERVARLAPCPVLVVREREREFVTLKRPGSGTGKRLKSRRAAQQRRRSP